MNATQAKLPEGSYWDNHPMLYASNDVSDPWSPKIMTGLKYQRDQQCGYQ